MRKAKTRAMTRYLVLAIAVGLLVLGSGAVSAREGQPAPRGLFTDSPVRANIERSTEPAVVRSRYVALNLDLLLGADGMPHDLTAAGYTLELNLFDDAMLTAVLGSVEETYGGGFAWTGQVQGEPLSLVTLALQDGVMEGTVLLPTNVYEISYAGNGVHTVAEIDQGTFPPEAEPIRVDRPEGALADAVPETVSDDGSVIDVMVVYTGAARSAAGGTPLMLSLINNAIIQTNATYAGSQINQRLRLVHTAEVSYVESGDIGTDLTRVRAVDGYMDVVHTWRNTYGADEVALIVEYPSGYLYCGIAYLMGTLSTGFESYAFAAIERECVTGNMSFAHELGHNMGAHHDWYVNDSTDLFTYSHGKVNTYDRWYTIMSYYKECSDRGVSCARIPYWSNPNLLLNGDPLGVPGGTSTACSAGQFDPYCDADNHRTLNVSAWTVANFRQSVVDSPPDAPTNLTATAVPLWRIDLSWNDNSSNEDGFRIERSSGGSWSTLAEVPANTTSYQDTTPTPGVTYSYRVFAHNGTVDSDPSRTVSAVLPEIVGPLVYSGYRTDADNGLINCGDTVGLAVYLENEGNTAVEGIASTLDPVGGTGLDDIDEIFANASPYPNIADGAIEGNLLPFVFSVKPMEEFAHHVDFELAIDADNWTGGPIEFRLPVLCAANADYRHYLPLVFK
jgi:hypothetical protein